MFYVMKKPLNEEQFVMKSGTQKVCEAYLESYVEASVRYGNFKKEAITFMVREENPQIDLDYPHVRLVHPTHATMTFDMYITRLRT